MLRFAAQPLARPGLGAPQAVEQARHVGAGADARAGAFGEAGRCGAERDDEQCEADRHADSRASCVPAGNSGSCL